MGWELMWGELLFLWGFPDFRARVLERGPSSTFSKPWDEVTLSCRGPAR